MNTNNALFIRAVHLHNLEVQPDIWFDRTLILDFLFYTITVGTVNDRPAYIILDTPVNGRPISYIPSEDFI